MTETAEPAEPTDPTDPTDPTEPPDLRLLVPALVAWCAAAGSLGAPSIGRGAAAVVLVLASGWTARAARRRLERGGRHARLRAGPGLAAAALASLAAGLVLASSGLQAWARDSGGVRALAQDGATVVVEGVVASDPRTLPARGHQPPMVMLRVSARSLAGRGAGRSVRARVLVFADQRWSGLRWGQQVRLRGRLGPSPTADDVVATLTARGPPEVTRAASSLDRRVEAVRAGLRRAVEPLPVDARGLLPGLVDGDTSQQPEDLAEAMRTTGLTHLSAVSGTNVSIVCAMALALARGIGLGRRTRLVAAGVLLAGFVLLARPEPSVLRAAVMGAIGLLAVGTSRRRAALPALSTAVVVLLVLDPWLARSFGFALSVLATLGLLLFATRWGRAWSRRLPGPLARPLATALAVPVAAQVTCTPLIVLLSGRVSLVAVPANLLAEPCVAPATVIGVAAAVVSPVSPWVAALLARVGGLPCQAIGWIARSLAEVPGGQLPWPDAAPAAVLLAVLLGAAVFLGPVLARRRRSLLVAAATVTVGVLLAVVRPSLPPRPGAGVWPPPGWVLVACDVGQGDALVLATGPGRGVLVDAGPDPDAVDDCLRDLAIRQLDTVVLTHFHADHVDGLAGAIRGRRVGQVVVTIVDDPPEQARRVRALAGRAGIDVRTVVDGETGRDGPLSWQVLWPGRVVHDGSVPNNASIVLRASAGGLSLLLLGDVEPAAARAVAVRARQAPGGPQVDVLKVAHHGSAQQDAGLIADARPRLALVSVGEGNDYGHPAPSLLRLLAEQGTVLARTDRQGDLAVVVRDGGLALSTSGPHRHEPRGRVSR
ncbi:ComEC/Rec2 family competence protein [Angustibacter luteus]|uniref:ComEC/Rec2 family competence protein n=1 Tax=Angustibacter luteus TaxID=658456 RepID=A0ABW1JKI4_9ACTN